MRAGGATLAASAGVPERKLHRHVTWKSTIVKDMYVTDSWSTTLAVSNTLDATL